MEQKKNQVVIYYWPSPRPVFWSLKSWTREPDQSYSWTNHFGLHQKSVVRS